MDLFHPGWLVVELGEALLLKGTENPNTSIPLLKLSKGLGVTTHVSWNWQSVMRGSCSSFLSGQTLPDELKTT